MTPRWDICAWVLLVLTCLGSPPALAQLPDLPMSDPTYPALHVVVEVASTDDFSRASEAFYVLSRETDRPTFLDVVLTGRRYEHANLSLDTSGDRNEVEVRLRGKDPRHPPILKEVPVTLEAFNVGIEDVVVAGSGRTGWVVSARVVHRFEMRRCAVVDSVRDDDFGGPLVVVGLIRQVSTATALVEDTWFIGNRQRKPAWLMSFPANFFTRFSAVELDNVACVANATEFVMTFNEAGSIRIRNSFLALTPRLKSELPLSIATIRYTRGAFSFRDSVLVVHTADDIVVWPYSDEVPLYRYPSSEFVGGTVVLREGGGLPGFVKDVTVVNGTPAPYAFTPEQVKALTRDAMAGKKPDAAALLRMVAPAPAVGADATPSETPSAP